MPDSFASIDDSLRVTRMRPDKIGKKNIEGGREGGGGGGGKREGRQKATKPGVFWQHDPTFRRADRFLLFNPMKRLILQTNRISGPALHYTGREKAQLALETIHRFLSERHARESFR